MDKLMNFQIGWLNKERLVFVIGIAGLIYGLVIFATSSTASYEAMKVVQYEKSTELDLRPIDSFDTTRLTAFAFKLERSLFTMLDAPQLEMDPPAPPTVSASLVPPPPYPQPSSKGHNRGESE